MGHTKHKEHRNQNELLIICVSYSLSQNILIKTILFMFGIEYHGKIRKCQPKVMKTHIQPWITFENNLGN